MVLLVICTKDIVVTINVVYNKGRAALGLAQVGKGKGDNHHVILS